MMDGREKNGGGLTIFTKFINSKYVYFNVTLNSLNVIILGPMIVITITKVILSH
jgi:hypothetical protein